MIQRLNLASLMAAYKRDGFAIVDGVLSPEAATAARATLWKAIDALRGNGGNTFSRIIDPNEANVRLYDLPDRDPLFLELLSAPAILEAVGEALGGAFLASNFSANIARPGAESMRMHSDLALVFPAPWQQSWSLNVIWCLDDVDEANGATRYLPDSHLFTSMADLPPNAEALMKPFEASAGSIIIMDGRLWHSSGKNSTADRDRAMMFGYYSRDFIRTQTNWYEALRPAVIRTLTAEQRNLFGFGPLANVSGASLVLLETS